MLNLAFDYLCCMNRIGYKVIKTKRRRVRPATGIRRKIGIGFVILGCLLLFAALISYFELSRLNRTTDELQEISLRDLDFSQRMIESVGKQNAALSILVYTPQVDSLDADSLFRAGRLEFDTAFAEAKALNIHTRKLNRINDAKDVYDKALQQLAQTRDSINWYNHQYKITYYDLLLPVKDFMVDSQNTIDQNTAKIQSNAYRAIMPGIITLAIAIIIIFVFYILIDLYYIRPVLKIKKGLDNYLNLKVPYNVQVEGHDEVKELTDQIATLVIMANKKENNA